MTAPKKLSLDDGTQQALIAMLGSQLGILRSIKDAEFRWLECYTILTGFIINYLIIGKSQTGLLPEELRIWLIILYFFITVYFHYILKNERQSYYRVLRSVIRAQNLLGLNKIKFLAESFANSAFPKGLGPFKEKDGTQPLKSFLARQFYVFIVFAVFFITAAYPNLKVKIWVLPTWGLLLFTYILWFFVFVFWRDGKDLYAATLKENGLAGAEPAWFPPEKGEKQTKQ